MWVTCGPLWQRAGGATRIVRGCGMVSCGVYVDRDVCSLASTTAQSPHVDEVRRTTWRAFSALFVERDGSLKRRCPALFMFCAQPISLIEFASRDWG
jgi:hypothetical protein